VVKQFRTLKCIKSETKKDLLRRLTKGKEFLDQNFTSEIDIEKVAVESNISQYHFFRLFKTVFGVSPYQYLKQKRLHKAQELLRSHQMPLAQLAIEVGYSDIFSFSKAFKQYFGFAPSKNV
jgi:AraC family transcriptional regulator